MSHVPSGERVLVVPRRLVPDGAKWYGLRTHDIDEFLEIVAAHARFEPRAEMEQDPQFKQIIPYLVLRDGDRYFLMRRTRAGGDVRLHDRWSIGVGGHLNPGDDGLSGGLQREWREELVADFEPAFTYRSPFIAEPWPATTVRIQKSGRTLELDFRIRPER